MSGYGEVLLAAGHATGRPGPVLLEAEDAYRDGRFWEVVPISAGRSAASKIAQINANGTAVMIGNAWNDGLFAPGQVADFYGRLTGPKRLMLSPGDHATAEDLQQSAFAKLRGLGETECSALLADNFHRLFPTIARVLT